MSMANHEQLELTGSELHAITGGQGSNYNVITWDPRGQYQSGGVLVLDHLAFEQQNVLSVFSWL